MQQLELYHQQFQQQQLELRHIYLRNEQLDDTLEIGIYFCLE